MTAPLTPPDCDLQDFPFIQLDVLRLRDSDLAIKVTGEEFRCAVLLWCASWHQVPAASLPDDDMTLSSLAGYGRAVGEWAKHRTGALRGWVKCDDGRLYHPVVAEKARDAWKAKLEQRWKTECNRVRKHNQRHGTTHVVPEFNEWVSLGCPQGQVLTVSGTGDESPRDNRPVPQPTGGGCPASVPRETPSKGEGEGQGEGQRELKDKNINPPQPPDDPPGAYLPDPTPVGAMAKLLRAKGVDVVPGNPEFRRWIESGLTEGEALAGLEAARGTKPAPEPISWAYLAGVLTRHRKAAQNVPDKPAAGAATRRSSDDWSRSDAGIDRKGRELGMFARGGESYPAFRDRIFEEIRRRAAKEQAA